MLRGRVLHVLNRMPSIATTHGRSIVLWSNQWSTRCHVQGEGVHKANACARYQELSEFDLDATNMGALWQHHAAARQPGAALSQAFSARPCIAARLGRHNSQSFGECVEPWRGPAAWWWACC